MCIYMSYQRIKTVMCNSFFSFVSFIFYSWFIDKFFDDWSVHHMLSVVGWFVVDCGWLVVVGLLLVAGWFVVGGGWFVVGDWLVCCW